MTMHAMKTHLWEVLSVIPVENTPEQPRSMWMYKRSFVGGPPPRAEGLRCLVMYSHDVGQVGFFMNQESMGVSSSLWEPVQHDHETYYPFAGVDLAIGEDYRDIAGYGCSVSTVDDGIGDSYAINVHFKFPSR